MKFIFISGGVVSGLGKGVTTASLAFLLRSRGHKVAPVKVDMYLNIDAGTIRPQEHGEVFVTHDGIETDEDIGHYERFLHENIRRENYITTGQVYQEIIRRERAFEYDGEDVEAIPHLTDEILRRIRLAGEVNKAEIVIVELGGTVGEYQNGIFFEASRILKLRRPRDVIHIHVTYLPYLANIGELKSKPAQTSVHILNGMGIQPDIIIARSEKPIDERRKDRLALFCNIDQKYLFLTPDVGSVYQIPILFHKPQHHLATEVLKLLRLPTQHHTLLTDWQKMVESITRAKRKVKIAVVGKYFVTGEYKLSDAYVSVVEAVRHAGWYLGIDPKLTWIDAEEFENDGEDRLLKFDGLIVPQGWGSRGTEGKIKAIKFAREKKIPYLGLCFGMQMAVVEFARNVLGFSDANTMEANPDTKYPVIYIMPGQIAYLSQKQYGGTIRLGAWPCKIKSATILERLYKKYDFKEAAWKFSRDFKRTTSDLIYERHRHRYEFNNKYKSKFEEKGFVISGTSPDGKLVEAIELPAKIHPFFIGTQFHPEYISRPLTPHPIFLGFLSSAAKAT